MPIEKILIFSLGVIIFLYLFWRQLREDYTQNQIFTSGFYILIGIALGSLSARFVKEEYWFWLGFAGAVVGFILSIVRFKLRFFEVLEAGVLSGITFLITMFLYRYLNEKDAGSLYAIVFLSFLILTYLILSKYYKKITWYKSGKVGFSALTVSGIFFLVRGVVALSGTTMLSLAGTQDALASFLLAFVSFLAIFRLSRQNV